MDMNDVMRLLRSTVTTFFKSNSYQIAAIPRHDALDQSS